MSIDPTEKDIADIDAMNAEPDQPERRTLLETWRELLTSIEPSLAERVSPRTALQIVREWPEITFYDVQAYHERYHEIMMQYREVLHEAIAAHPDCLKKINPDPEHEDFDAVANHDVYMDVLFGWNILTIRLEQEWDTTAFDASIQIAAMADAANFYTGPNGMVQHLNSEEFGFRFAQEDQIEMAARVEAARAEL